MSAAFAQRWQPVARRLALLARPRMPEALPVALDRHRIYVLPTPFGLFLGGLLTVMGIGALNYNNNPALLLCLMLGGAAGTSLLAAHLQLSGLRVTAIDAEPVAAGKPITVRVHAAAAPGRDRRGLLVDVDGLAAELSLAGGHGVATLQLPTLKRGWFEPGRLRLSTTRPLGVARAWAYVWPAEPLLVHPAPEAHGPPLPVGRGDDAQARITPAGDELHHLRAYRQGDSRRAIAWKPSARRDTLLVREFEQPRGADIVLAWRDLGALPYEDRIRRLARWVDEAEREGRRYRLDLPAQPAIGPGRGAPHRLACLRALALMPEVARG